MSYIDKAKIKHCYVGNEKIKKIYVGRDVVFTEDTPALNPMWIKAKEDNTTVMISNAVTKNLEYSINGGPWTEWDWTTSTVTLEHSEDVIRFRGDNETWSTNNDPVTFNADKGFYLGGNVTSTLSKDEVVERSPSYAFYKMFFQSNVVDASEFVINVTEVLSYGCVDMFNGCAGLIRAPQLPATAADAAAYKQMFYGCTSLTTPPQSFNISMIYQSVCESMFEGCKNLQSVMLMPNLGGGRIALNGCKQMYSGCSSLITIPMDLISGAGRVDSDGCRAMFEICTNLQNVCWIPATQVQSGAYMSMFWGCTSLVTIPDDLFLELDEVPENCYRYMFYNCTNLTNMPRLPSTNLGKGCYAQMFAKTSISSISHTLPATTLKEQCYYQMFQETKLTSTAVMAATTLAKDCCKAMYENCSLLTNPGNLSATMLAEGCYMLMFTGCTSITRAPILQAETLADQCYVSMFQGCSSLKVNEDGEGNPIFTCPSTEGLTDPVNAMFSGTGGTFTRKPTTGHTYNWYTN